MHPVGEKKKKKKDGREKDLIILMHQWTSSIWYVGVTICVLKEVLSMVSLYINL